MNIIEKLAEIHSKWNLHVAPIMKDMSILKEVDNIEDLKYLSSLYSSYLYNTSKGISPEQNILNSNVAKNADLFFIGKDAFKTEKIKFMFIFEGSLQPPLRLSITALSCLWILDDSETVKNLAANYWNYSKYKFVKESLNLTKDVASESYVVDSVRIANAYGKSDIKKC